MRPHLVRWQEEYAEQGLLVIEITGGEQEPLNVVRDIVEKQQLNHPVLWDWKCRNHDNPQKIPGYAENNFAPPDIVFVCH